MKNANKIYTFSWIDEEGSTTGWNDVQAPNMTEARKEARKMETKAGWRLWNGTDYVVVPNEVKNVENKPDFHCFRNKGMYIDPKSFRKTSVEKHFENHRMAEMMSR